MPPTPGTPPFGVNILSFIPQAEWAAITATTSTYACRPALLSAIAALPAQGGAITVPPGVYNIGSTVQLKKCVHLKGAGSGQAGGEVTRLKWPDNTTGFVVNTGTTDAADGAGAADGSVIEGIHLIGTTFGSTSGHGIHLRSRAQIRNCQVEAFGLDGIHIEASVSGSDLGGTLGNANNWYVETCWVQQNNRHGLYCVGSDANSGMGQAVSASNNGGWGIYDASFLGNAFVGCHTEANRGGAYHADNANAASVFIGCYSESGQPATDIAQRCVVIGGLHSAGFAANMAGRIIAVTAVAADSPFAINDLNSPVLTTRLGQNGSGLAVNTTGNGTDTQIGFWQASSGCFVDTYGGQDADVSIMRTTSLTKLVDFDNYPAKVPAGQFVLPQTHWVNLGGAAKRVTNSYAAAAPTSGTWAVGNIVYDTAPVSGGYLGWVCTVAGTPGKWSTWGPIS